MTQLEFEAISQQKYYLMNLNVLTKVKWTKQDKTTVQASHPPLETILLEHKNSKVITL